MTTKHNGASPRRGKVRPDPRVYLDTRALSLKQDPAGFFAEYLATLFPDSRKAQENAAFLRWLSGAIAEDRQLLTNDPTLLLALGNLAADGKGRRAVIRYLSAVDAAVKLAQERHAANPGAVG